MQTLFKFYIKSSIHVALAVVALCLLTAFIHDLALNFWVHLFVFFSTVVGYNFVKYASRSKNYPLSPRSPSVSIQVFSGISIIGIVACCFFISLNTLVFVGILGLFNLFYAIPLGGNTLREVPFLKVFIIAFIWTGVSLGIPLIDADKTISLELNFNFEIIERFCWVLLLLIPFEIRDLKYDRIHLKTLTTAFGITGLKIVGVGMCLALVMTRVLVKALVFELFDVLVYASLILAISLSNTNQKTYFASFWVEALPIFWLLIWLIIDYASYSS